MVDAQPPQQTDAHEMKLRKLLELFWNNSHPAFKETDTEPPHELTILYELATIFYIAINLVPEKITILNRELRCTYDYRSVRTAAVLLFVFTKDEVVFLCF